MSHFEDAAVAKARGIPNKHMKIECAGEAYHGGIGDNCIL